jgi:ATP-binding cassette subfamily B protein
LLPSSSYYRGGVSVTDLITFLLYITTFTEPVKKLINFTETFQNGITGYERFLEILAIEPDIKDREKAIPLREVRGDIEFKDVSFRYQGTSEYVVSNVNVKVNSGDYVALVGHSGVGKTTLCSLIPRFYEVSSGEILIDGKDIRDVTLKSLRRNIGLVQQDIYLFAGTVMDNIRYGKPEADEEDVIIAAKKRMLMNLS